MTAEREVTGSDLVPASGGALVPQSRDLARRGLVSLAPLVRVLLVNADGFSRERIRDYSSSDAEAQIVGVVGSEDEGLALTRELRPDIIVSDYMYVLDGIPLAERVRLENKDLEVVIFSVHEEPHFLRWCSGAGVAATAFIPDLGTLREVILLGQRP